MPKSYGRWALCSRGAKRDEMVVAERIFFSVWREGFEFRAPSAIEKVRIAISKRICVVTAARERLELRRHVSDLWAETGASFDRVRSPSRIVRLCNFALRFLSGMYAAMDGVRLGVSTSRSKAHKRTIGEGVGIQA